MTGKFKFNRQKNDYILTDLLPTEKGNHFTHRFFYEYLQDEKKTLKRLIKNIKTQNNKFFDNKWHSSPLKFKISKKEENFREIALINPLGIVESLCFIEIFENDILNIIHNKKDFSVRKANRTNSLVYKKMKNQTVYYSDLESKNQLLLSLESSGSFFQHQPFKNITRLMNSKRFTYSRDKFDFLLSLDIQDCFPSIYTHSYKWLISKKTYDSKKLSESTSIYSNIDTLLQNLNGSKTNGIIVGPEISRLLADFLFVHIDQEILELLAMQNLNFRSDYIVYRFVDDYFICSSSIEIQNTIKDTIESTLNKYHLKINNSKISMHGKDEIINNWKIEVKPIIETIDYIFYSYEKEELNSLPMLFDFKLPEEYTEAFLEVAASLMSSEKKNININGKLITYIDLRSRVLSIIKSSNEKTLVCSYILSTILRKIEVDHKNKDFKINMQLNEFITFILFIYSLNVSYSSTQKIIRIFSLLVDNFQLNLNELIERNFERFEDKIITKFSNDWIDLLLFFANYNINTSYKFVEKIVDIFIRDENPVQLAALCIFAESNSTFKNKINRSINNVILNNIKKINWNDFFQDEQGWWVYIFLSYPKLRKSTKKCIIDNLTILKTTLKSDPSDNAKLIILDFLLNKKSHFIEWKFTQENYYKKYFFYTKDKTVFNPDVVDQISISR